MTQDVEAGEASEPLPRIPGFEIVRRVGKGGMGEIFEAVRAGPGGFRKVVALKTISFDREQNDETVQRFLREARISAQLDHPNIVRVHDLLTVGTGYCLVMELLKGKDLEDVFRTLDPPIPAWIPLSVVQQALLGLEYAHALRGEDGKALGLVHRDLTPGNLFILENGTVKILDFGIAKLKDGAANVTRQGYVAGTVAFLSPEQARGEEADGRSDVYQLGASLYYVLGNTSPHGEGTVAEQLQRALRTIEPPLDKLRPDLSPKIVQLVHKAMQVRREDRFQSAHQMRGALEEALKELPERGPEALGRLVRRLGNPTEVPTELDAPALPPGPMSLLATSPGRAGSVGARPASEGGENGGLREHAPFHSPPADAAADTLVSRRGPEEKQSPPPRTLREALPGTLIAGRYRIIRFIAQGGMGEVYEAEDTELSERLALKTIRPELSRGELAIERFKREIHLARRVTHPNVCRIFDIGYHLLVQPPAGEQPRTGDSIIFLTMELLHGETLAARVARMGKLHPDEALFVAEQMAAGLGAAHRAGVVHRDFKSENVFLVPTAGTPSAAPGEPPIRVVITDFGVARATAQGGARLTTDEFIGSPAYMAPEQVEGKTVTAASDIYALGVVLYEAVTGALPFDGDSPLAVALARLREAPPPPRSKVPELPARWNDAVMKCLERDPAARPQSTEEVIADLTGEMPRWAVSGVTRSRVKAMERRRRIVLALVAVLALGGGVAAAWFAQGLLGGTSRSARARPTVAVLGFKNLSGKPDQAWLSTALAETLSAELGGSGSLRILPAESVARMRAELKLPDSAGLSRETLAKVRTNLGADLVVGGSYLALGEKAGGTIQLNVQVQDATGGSEDAQAIAESGSEARLLELVARAGKRLRGQLGAGELAAESAGAVAQQLPRGTDAARAYADGLARLRRWDHLGARASLEAAVKADPNHPLAHAYLARALARLGYEARAAEQAKKAFDLSGSLGKEEQLQIQAQLRESTKEWSKAAEVWRALWTFYPDNVEYGVELCRILYWAEKPQEALKVAAQLHALPGAAGLDPRIDLYEAQAWSALSDYPKQVAAAQKAARSAEANGQSALASRALSQQGWGLHDMGKNAEAKPLFEKELALCRAAGDKACEATADSNLGTIAEAVGDFEGAKADYQKALLVNREIGDLLAAAQTLNNLGSALHGQGRLAETRKVWEEALKLERERDEKSGVAMMSFNLGNLLMDMGDLAAAKKGYAEAGVLYRELGQKSGLAAVLFGEGNILFTEGDLAGARQKLDESRRTCEEIKFKLGASEATALLGDIAFSEGNFSEARRRMQEALERRQEMGDKARVADSKVNLAKLSIEDGRFDEAVKLASEAVAEFKAAKAPDREAFARAALAEAYLGAGKKDEAEKAAQEAAALLAPGQGVSARFEVGTIRARTKAASGKGLEAVKELEALVAEESRLGFYGDSLESRLRLGEAEISAGRASDGRTHLDALSREAKEKGFGRVARKAAAHGQKSG